MNKKRVGIVNLMCEITNQHFQGSGPSAHRITLNIYT